MNIRVIVSKLHLEANLVTPCMLEHYIIMWGFRPELQSNPLYTWNICPLDILTLLDHKNLVLKWLFKVFNICVVAIINCSANFFLQKCSVILPKGVILGFSTHVQIPEVQRNSGSSTSITYITQTSICCWLRVSLPLESTAGMTTDVTWPYLCMNYIGGSRLF